MAYIGKTGQDEYKLVIKFGQKALSRYASDLDITETIPAAEEKDGYTIDIDNKQIEIQLH